MTQQVPLEMLSGVTPAAIGALAQTALAPYLRGYLAGLGLSTPGGSVLFTVQPGVAANSTNVDAMTLAASLQKAGNATWAVGASGGSLDTGALAANTWYHVFLIKRPDTGAVDVLTSLSATAPAMPASYTLFRRIGSMKTNGSSVWASFIQVGDEFILSTPVQDVAVSNLGSTPTLYTLASVPPGFNIKARVRGFATNATLNTLTAIGSIYDSVTPNTPSGNITVSNAAAGTGQGCSFTLDILTDTAQRIQAAASNASTTLQIVTYGWIDRRGRD